MKKLGLMLVVVLYSGYTCADIYKHIGSDGSVFYTDKPKKGLSYKRVIKSKSTSKSRSKSKLVIKNNPYRNINKNKKKYSALIARAAAKYKIDKKLLHAVIRTESAYNVKAVSSAGAVGLMQLMPATAARYGVSDRTDAKQNIEGGTRYLKDLMKMFKSNLSLVLASYNAGEGAVKRYNNSIPPYPETQNYVRKVLKLYKNPSALTFYAKPEVGSSHLRNKKLVGS